MIGSILATKLHIPPERTNQVTRDRLLRKLDNGLRIGCKLALISAPAGFGKTTLASKWISTISASSTNPKTQTAWVSLDPSDNDLAIFLSYFLAAVRRCIPEAGEAVQQMLGGAALPPVDTLLLPLVNDLATAGQPIVLVFDDYHVIQQPQIHEAVAFLIERMPPGMQIVITTRQDPLLPVARWRARGQLVEIRLKDLRFTLEEAAEFLNKSMALGLTPEDVAALDSRTEGWIAGLQLAAISLQQSDGYSGGGTISDQVEAFTGNDRFVMDYLIEEVLCRQPEAVQQFLLHTSVLDRFSAGLCTAVIDNGEPAGPIIEYLDRANLFLIQLDHQREWYRYHHLFAELLQHRLKTTYGANFISVLKRRASRWFESQNMANESIAYAQSAEDWEQSTRLIIANSQLLFRQGETATFLRWFRVMPVEVIQANPSLSMSYGYALSITGELILGQRFLTAAEEGFADDPDQLGITLTFASYNACLRGDFITEIEQARRALSLLSDKNEWIRGTALVTLGLGLFHIGDIEGCEAAMQEGLATGQRADNARTCIQSLTNLGRINVIRLDFAQAESCFREAGQIKVDGRSFPGTDMSLFDLSLLKYEQNELEQAMDYVEQGLAVNQRSGNIEMRAYGYRLEARLHQLKGQAELAKDYMAKVEELARNLNCSPLTLSLNAACRVEMALWENDLAVAEKAAPHIGNSVGVYAFNFFPEMAWVHLLLTQGRRQEAINLLKPAVRSAEQPGWNYPRLQVRVLQALAEKNPVQAREYLAEAISLAAPHGAVRAFVDLGEPMLSLLKQARPHLPPTAQAYIDRLIPAFGDVPVAKPPAAAAVPRPDQPLVEPLTDRELEVLALLADGLSNAEIAARLYLSPNTLKAHTQNIYAKMDVHSRVQVVNKARQLGLIP